MTIQTFEYCSLHYLNQWLTHDLSYCDILLNGNQEDKLTALKNAGVFYRVARNLPTKFDVKKGIRRYQPVLDILDGIKEEQFKENPIEKILETQREISKKYSGKSVLSLTTKFLWLKLKQPILIYDSRARIER